MVFCKNCGKELRAGARFCGNCGTQTGTNQTQNGEKRRQEYAGKLIKCPACGERVQSFVAVCPCCGHELRNVSSTDSVKELMKTLETAKTDSVKAGMIRTFPIPNTREDILEFMILASTNIENSFQMEVAEAWIVKFEQAYEKSMIMFGETPEVSRCHELFLEKKKTVYKNMKRVERNAARKQKREETDKKRERSSKFFDKNKEWILPAAGLVGLLLFFVGVMVIPHTINEAQLNGLVSEVEACIEAGELEAARRKADQIIDDSGWSDESEEKWDSIRESLLAAIERKEIEIGQKIPVGTSLEDMKGKNYQSVVAALKYRGYTNVRAEAIADLVTGWVIGDGEVEKITIDGTTNFDEQSLFAPNVEIVVFYHAFK